MSKYIPQINNTNFVYPNYDLAEYDVDIIHNINDNSVTGTVNSFTVSGVTSTGMTVVWGITWNLNGAEPFIRNIGNYSTTTLHMLGATQTYYKPWRAVSSVAVSAGTTTQTTSRADIITPSQLGLTTFTSGTYYFEIRFIGATSIYPVCQTLFITVP